MDVFLGFNDTAEEEQKSLKYSKIINDLENDIHEIESLPNSGEYKYIVYLFAIFNIQVVGIINLGWLRYKLPFSTDLKL